MINGNALAGAIPILYEKKGAAFQLVYNLTGLTVLKEYLKSPFNKETFAFMIRDILEKYEKLQENVFNQQNVLLDLEHVFVNPATREICYIYVPIQFYQNQVNMKGFFLDLVQACTFVASEDNSYVAQYIQVLNSNMNFSFFEFKGFVETLIGQKEHIQCPKCNISVEVGSIFCPNCGTRLVKEKAQHRSIYDPLCAGQKVSSCPENRVNLEKESPNVKKTLVGDWAVKYGKDTTVASRFSAELGDKIADFTGVNTKNVGDGIKVGTKWAGVIFDGAVEGIENYQEYQSKKGTAEEISVERAVGETVIETGVSVWLGILGGAGAAALLGATTPAVVVAAVGATTVWAADKIFEKFVGKDIGESVSDTIMDGIESVSNKLFCKQVDSTNITARWA